MSKEHTPCCLTCEHYTSVNAAKHFGICLNSFETIEESDAHHCDSWKPDGNHIGGDQNAE